MVQGDALYNEEARKLHMRCNKLSIGIENPMELLFLRMAS